MYKVRFSANARTTVRKYSRMYREYFEETYSDTGIWSENQILEQYRNESIRRYEEIVDLLVKQLSNSVILGRTSDNAAVFSWRSKILLVSWEESGDTRTITELSIR